MKKEKHIFIKVLLSVILSVLLAVCLQITVHFTNPMHQIIFLAAASAVCFIITVIPKFRLKRYIVSFVCILAAAGIACGSFIGIHRYYEKDSVYSSPDSTNDFFKNKKALIIVPHQDDDINTTGGLIDLFRRNESSVYIIFTTNGDSYGLGETRLKESLEVADFYGMPRENVIFLGYANGWKNANEHIYSTGPDYVLESKVGRTATYGIDGHPAYNDGNAYTRNNLKTDLKDAVLEINPDIIFCVDCDFHPDHRMTSLIFEEVMGEILSQKDDFRPLVFKSFAYCTAFYGKFDFYSKNIYSTKVECKNDLVPDINIYRWSERLRLPAASDSMSRYLRTGSTYKALDLYPSQYITKQAQGVINGDKVFWKRNTESILYNAEITATSGDAKLLNNFKLLEINDIKNAKALPFDGTWIPESADTEKKITVKLKDVQNISEIRLYDSPSTEDNILSAEIKFDSGAVIETGALESNGSATVIPCNQQNVSSFEITVKNSEGKAGLTEIEAYKENPDKDNIRLMKIINGNDDFVYDYYIDRSGSEEFSLYTYGCAPCRDSDYSIKCDGSSCSASIKNGKIKVSCPKGQKCTLTVTDNKNKVSDTVIISNPKDIALRNLAQKFDRMYNETYSTENQILYYYTIKSEIYRLIFGK